MNSITKTFDKLKAQSKTAFVPFSVAGYPDIDKSTKVFKKLCSADVIEFGFPFSDPIADGPVIQAAATGAIKAGVSMDKAFGMIRELRRHSATPIVFFSYFNPIHKYGVERFVSEAKAAGVNGVLIVDLPMEESRWLKPLTDEAGMAWINLITPTTPTERVKQLDAHGSGFLYYVSVLGVTGARAALPDDLAERCRRIRDCAKLPLVVGFGISTPEQAAMLKGHVDGVVVGSAIVSKISNGLGDLDGWLKSMKESLG